MADGTGENRDAVGAAAAAVTPDPVTAELLAKHAAGEKLDASGYGKLGAWKAKLKTFWGGKDGSGSQSAVRTPPIGNAPAVVALAASAAASDGLATPPVDPGLCQRTAAAILNRTDAVTVGWVASAARKAGAEGATLERFRGAARLPKDDRQLIIDLAPDIAAELGLDPRKFPLLIAAGVFVAHWANLWLAVDELKQLRAKQTQPTPPKSSSAPPAPTVTVPAPVATPAKPPNAPAEIFGP